MATIHGKSAQYKLTTDIVADMGDWSIDANLELADDSAMGDSWRSKVAGLAAWSGSASGSFNLLDTYQKVVHDLLVAATPTGTHAISRFYVNTSSYYHGTIFISNIRINAAIGDVIKISFSFTGSGALTYVP